MTSDAEFRDLPARKWVTVDGVNKRNSHYVWFQNTGYWPDFKNKQEVVHHIDGDISNDDFSNLRLMTNADHSTFHNIGEGCIISKMVGKCGPYLYHVRRVRGKQYWKYLGKVGSARAQAAQEAHARIYQPDDEEDEPLNRVGKSEEELA